MADRDEVELGERVGLGLRQENIENLDRPSPLSIITMRAIAAMMGPEYTVGCGFSEEAYCRDVLLAPAAEMARFEVFTQRHGDVVFTTRFRFVARLVTRFVRTLGYDYPIPLVPVTQEFEEVTKTPTGWACTCGETDCAHILPCAALKPCACSSAGDGTNPCPREDECHTNWLAKRSAAEGAYEKPEYNAAVCPDCGHDHYHDAQGRCMYPMGFGDEARVCGWHPDVMGPVPCESRVETPESLEAGRMCYEGRCPRCRGEGCQEQEGIVRKVIRRWRGL